MQTSLDLFMLFYDFFCMKIEYKNDYFLFWCMYVPPKCPEKNYLDDIIN